MTFAALLSLTFSISAAEAAEPMCGHHKPKEEKQKPDKDKPKKDESEDGKKSPPKDKEVKPKTPKQA